MAFSQQFLDELRARVGLVDVIGRRVRLIRKGREHSGLCPFHNEKTPSFTVNEEKGFYHCFGCGAHGSAIDFVMQLDKLTFPEAVERLAGEAGMEVPRAAPADREREARAKTLLDVVEAACRFFERQLRLPDGKHALDYLLGRGIREESIRTFRLGFAPDGRGALKAHLAREGVSEAAMIEAGLVIQPEDAGRGTYDRFRGRVMFPIMDARGRVIAFGGRVMAAAGVGPGRSAATHDSPKYLNSPETPLFHKGFNLYGLAQALTTIRERGQAIVVEGYTDVIALHQAGIATALAPLGTALTEDQMRLLWRHAAEPILCFDGDAAGQRAAARAAERALPILQPGKGLGFVELPAGEDPDTLVRTRGAAAVAELVKAARPLSEVVWQIETQGRAIQTPEARAGLDARFRELTGRIGDETVRRHYQTAFRNRIWDLYWGKRKRRGKPLTQSGGNRARNHDRTFIETVLVAIPIAHPPLFDIIGERLGTIDFVSAEIDRIRQILVRFLSENAQIEHRKLADHLAEAGQGSFVERCLADRILQLHEVRPSGDRERALQQWETSYAALEKIEALNEITKHIDIEVTVDSEKAAKIRALAAEVSKGTEQKTQGHHEGWTEEKARAVKEFALNARRAAKMGSE